MSDATVHSSEHREDHSEFVRRWKQQQTDAGREETQGSNDEGKHLATTAREIALAGCCMWAQNDPAFSSL